MADKKKKKSKIDAQPHVKAAEETVRLAREELRKAEQCYQDVREKAVQQVEQLRQTNLGDLLDGTVKLARKYPGASLVAATVAGFFLGRLFRR